MKRLIYKLLLVAICLVVSTSAFAAPEVDGFFDGSSVYTNSFTAGWYNGHEEAGSQFKKADDHTTTVYYENIADGGADDGFYLYIEAPLEAKNMIWANNVADLTPAQSDLFQAEALLYYQHWSSPPEGEMADLFPNGNQQHHKDGFDKFFNEKMNFGGMTGSEKLVIPGQGTLADLGKGLGDVGAFYGNVVEYADSVDYVINNLGYSDELSLAYDIPMAFEFKFDFLNDGQITALINDIQGNELEFHMSPERGGDSEPVPEPATIALLGIGLAGLAGAEVRRRRKRKAVDKS